MTRLYQQYPLYLQYSLCSQYNLCVQAHLCVQVLEVHSYSHLRFQVLVHRQVNLQKHVQVNVVAKFQLRFQLLHHSIVLFCFCLFLLLSILWTILDRKIQLS
mmetsp:Transcript_14643/g.35378  ORF Transcript_14643/g.35378 Transcript_14643/m.35378 type:complete len:102 (-) Transcript_14643:2910-3215(-)